VKFAVGCWMLDVRHCDPANGGRSNWFLGFDFINDSR
jgi:hypothetical protein